MMTALAWQMIGFVGQGVFTARFVVQWIASEKKGDSVVPVAFWWLSILGGSGLLVYAIHRRDPVFIVGQGFGMVVYVRNLMLVGRRRAGSWHRGPHSKAGRSSRIASSDRTAA